MNRAMRFVLTVATALTALVACQPDQSRWLDMPAGTEPAVTAVPSDPPIVPVVGPGLSFIPRPPTSLPPGAVDPGDGTPIIYNPNDYSICDAAGVCVHVEGTR